MQNITDFINNGINEARVDWRNVHDAILNVLRKYTEKPGIPQDVRNYCNNVREALENVKH